MHIIYEGKSPRLPSALLEKGYMAQASGVPGHCTIPYVDLPRFEKGRHTMNMGNNTLTWGWESRLNKNGEERGRQLRTGIHLSLLSDFRQCDQLLHTTKHSGHRGL